MNQRERLDNQFRLCIRLRRVAVLITVSSMLISFVLFNVLAIEQPYVIWLFMLFVAIGLGCLVAANTLPFFYRTPCPKCGKNLFSHTLMLDRSNAHHWGIDIRNRRRPEFEKCPECNSNID